MNILSIDAWAGNEPKTWEWNNWYSVGEFPKELIESKPQIILKWFRKNGYLNKGVGLNRCYIEDDQYNLVICSRVDCKPLYAIEYGKNS